MNTNNLFENLTIIIPTHERPISLKRQLDYIKDFNKHLNILILDSSNHSKKEYKNNRNYIHIKGKNANIKIAKILNNIKTKYVVTIGDDDFFIFSTLIKCLKFLQNNNDYDGVHGEYVIHSKLLNHKFFNKYKFIREEYPTRYKLKKNEKFENAYQYINGQLPPLNYALFRTKIFKKVWELSTLPKSEAQVFLELVPSFMFYLLGNIKRLKDYYISREKSPRNNKQVQFHNEGDYNKLKNFIYKDLHKKKILNFNQYKKILKLIEIKKFSEVSVVKRYKFKINTYKLMKLFSLIYILLFKKVEFDFKKIKHYLLKYPEVLNEVNNTISRDYK